MSNYSLLCYTREAGREEANNEDIARHAFGDVPR